MFSVHSSPYIYPRGLAANLPRKLPGLAVVALILTLFTGSVFAAVVEYTQDRRFVSIIKSIDGNVYEDVTYTPVPAYSDFQVLSTASFRGYQDSSLQSSGFSAFGVASDDGGGGYWHDETSVFDVTFVLTSAAEMVISGNLYGEIWDPRYPWNGSTVALYSGDSTAPASLLYSEEHTQDSSPLFLNYSTTLAAGEYRLVASARDGYSSFNFDASFTPAPVPVPGAMWLFGSALLGVVGVGIRRKGPGSR